MVNCNPKRPQHLPAALILISAAVFICILTDSRVFATPIFQQSSTDPRHSKLNSRPPEIADRAGASEDPKTGEAPTTYSYEFSQPEFLIRRIVIEHNENGVGTISFERKNEEIPVVEPVEISAAAWSRIKSNWEALHFLDSDAEYQSNKQFAHLGTMRLKMTRGTRERTAEFNWSNNPNATNLVNEYRRIADQAIFVFDISVARENQPLNAPKLMDHLESMLKRNWISDPQQLIPLLKDISNDEHIPLIARNHALRLLKKIEK